jgi:hypothetical protein
MKEQEHDQFVESGKYGGIGLTVVGIDEAGERISHLHAAYLTGNLSGFEDELQGQSEKEPNGEFAEQKHEERGRGNRGRRRGNQRRHERGEQESESNLTRGGTAALPKKGATTSRPVTRDPAIIQAATVRSRGRANGIAMGIWSTITSTATNYRSLAALGMTISYFGPHRFFIGQKGESRTTGRW